MADMPAEEVCLVLQLQSESAQSASQSPSSSVVLSQISTAGPEWPIEETLLLPPQSGSEPSVSQSPSSSALLLQQDSCPLLLQLLFEHVGPEQTLEEESELTDVLTLLLERLVLVLLTEVECPGTAGVAGVPVPGEGTAGVVPLGVVVGVVPRVSVSVRGVGVETGCVGTVPGTTFFGLSTEIMSGPESWFNF
jgi:hypothetical protein